MKQLISIIDQFKGKKIGVIGDLMLDHFVFGNVDRVSPEAPVPVVLFSREMYILGGAANVANNIASLGGSVSLIGVLGQDNAKDYFIKEVQSREIDCRGILTLSGRHTTEKIRIVAHGQHIVRIDKEETVLIDDKAENKIIDFVRSHIKQWDIVVISDYNKGCVTKNVALQIIALAKRYNKHVIADIKPNNLSYYKDIFLLVPNKKEALVMSGFSDVKKAGKFIQKKLHCNVLLKRSAEGMTLFEKSNMVDFSAKAKEVFDVSGAGDTVIATMALALSCGATLKDSAMIANYSAGVSVAKIGTAVVFVEELKKEILADE